MAINGFGFTPMATFGVGAVPLGQNSLQSPALQAGLQAGLAEGFLASQGLQEGLGGPLGGLGGGFGNPLMSLGSLAQASPCQLDGMLPLLGGLQQTTGCQGMGCAGLGGPQNLGGPGQGQGGTIELEPGQSYTTPGGCTVSWELGKKSEVDVSEPGGGGQQLGGEAAEPEGEASASASAGPLGAAAAASSAGGAAAAAGGLSGSSAAASTGEGGGCGCPPTQGAGSAPQSWDVHGDPHIKNPNGKNSNFTTPNSMFTLQDGSKVIMCAEGAHKKVNRVQVVLPGAQPNWNGIDPSKTSVMQEQGGMFKPMGTAAQMIGGGFGS